MLKTFELGENKINYWIERTSRRRSVAIQVMPDSRVVFRIPKRFSEKELSAILSKRLSWILERQAYFKIHYKPLSLSSGSKIPYLGDELLFEIERRDFIQKRIVLEEKRMTVFLRHTETQQKVVSAQVLKWYREQALEKILESIGRFQILLGVSPKKISIRNQRQRWGSCNQRHHLNFNWRLILLPQAILDYVVVHELCHILHLDHSFRFWEKVRSLLPDFRESRQWLKERSAELLSFPSLPSINGPQL